jgi:transposase
MPTAFAARSDQGEPYQSFQDDVHANAPSATMNGAIVIAGGSKQPLKDFRRVATRYDKLALNFLSAVVLAAIIAFWV